LWDTITVELGSIGTAKLSWPTPKQQLRASGPRLVVACPDSEVTPEDHAALTHYQEFDG
jgi:hypothetical protein